MKSLFPVRRLLAGVVLACGLASAQAAETAICYNCPLEWADWGAQLKAIAADTGIEVPQDNKNSGQSLAQLVAERETPVADVVYYGVTFGIQAAKAGVLGLTRAMAREFGPDGIRVNALTPGLIQTDITGGLMHDERRQSIIDGIPLGRLGEPRDVANAALFLASDLSGYLTGVTLDVNGGMLIH